ncbi:TetR/AcrR family transcriptional regulator [Aeromicrobium phragmitis]|uniref:TetR/AcrR family transcriptional regulator n=1 Tax=Aeromicrobium phragmitis TaxID=2478914 RepID=A0A3L8PP54_9ACTN|nr:TetR/AcrR family transcriptional regulator [Aeromicrobium phragmitis]RLV57110.1 TetR/AcrR family transcriptional regulator [Aeromicrobium phragmitis]
MSEQPLSRSARKRADILAAAEALFLSRGYLGASVDDVARRAQVSKPTVYAHFGSKEALFVAVVSAMTGDAGDRVHDRRSWKPDDLGDDVAAHLQQYGLRQLTVVLEPRLLQLRRLVIGEVPRFPDLAKALFDGGPARAITELSGLIAAYAERGVLRVDDPHAAATHFNWMVMGAPLNEAMLLGDEGAPDELALQRHVTEAVRIFVAAYS